MSNWAVVDENGKVIEKFRLKQTAFYWLPKLRKIVRKNLEIKQI